MWNLQKREFSENPWNGTTSVFLFLFIITLFEANANKNQLTNIKAFIKGESYREKTLHKTQALSIFSCCFKLVLSSAIDLLDFIELGSWLHISVAPNGVEFVPWVVSLTGWMSIAPFLISYGTSLSMKKVITSLGSVVINFRQ